MEQQLFLHTPTASLSRPSLAMCGILAFSLVSNLYGAATTPVVEEASSTKFVETLLKPTSDFNGIVDNTHFPGESRTTEQLTAHQVTTLSKLKKSYMQLLEALFQRLKEKAQEAREARKLHISPLSWYQFLKYQCYVPSYQHTLEAAVLKWLDETTNGESNFKALQLDNFKGLAAFISTTENTASETTKKAAFARYVVTNYLQLQEASVETAIRRWKYKVAMGSVALGGLWYYRAKLNGWCIAAAMLFCSRRLPRKQATKRQARRPLYKLLVTAI